MSKMSGARLCLTLFVVGMGFVLSFGLGKALAGEDITED